MWKGIMRRILATLTVILALLQLGIVQLATAQTPLALTSSDGVPTLAPLVKKVTPSVVNIAIKGRVAQQQNPLFNDPFFRRFFGLPEVPAEREVRAAGSGVIIDAHEGLVVTNHHVVQHADEITVTLADGRRFEATRVGSDPETDIAIVKIAADHLNAIDLGDSDKLEVGDYVVAIGNPFGLGQTVTSGIVSALRRSGLGIEGYEDFIQTDAPINPGNSGGALVNLHGELVGINTAIVGPSGGNVGIGFAIPTNMVREVLNQLVQFGEVRRGRLGIVIQDVTPELARAMRLREHQRGAIVAKIEPGSPAEAAGLKVGDVITEIDEVTVRSSADLRNRVGLKRVGDTTRLTVVRGGATIIIEATIAVPAAKTHAEGAGLSPLLDGASFAPLGGEAPVKGVEVVEVRAASKADSAGLRKGDIVVSVNQVPVTGIEEFASAVKESPDQLLLNILRGDAALFLFLQ
jgi:serine protease Do/serine protease DegQ